MITTDDQYWLERASCMYQAYGESVEFKNYQGLPIPEWKDLPEKIQNVWVAAALRGQIDSANLLLKTVTEDNAQSHL